LRHDRVIRPERIVGVIPARWGATRFPGKMLAPINGQPLLDWVIRGCLRSRRVTRWRVATDDRRIAALAHAAGVEAVMTSPRLASGSDRVAAAVRNLHVDWVVNWQGDEWLPDGRPIDALVSALESVPHPAVATLVRALPPREAKNPHRVKVALSDSARALYFSRAAIPYDAAGTQPYWLHVGAYAFPKDLLLQFRRWRPTPLERREKLEQLRLLEHGVPIVAAICRVATFGVDTPADARRLTRHVQRLRIR
jgi:3-deoxy-manno-octulosonate cytidylyltransferase (CMP-KDO synthetase)